jgi:DNA relaxase NicK
VKFDWYQATIDASHDEVVGLLLRHAGPHAHVQPHRGKTHGYESAYDVAIGPQVYATAFYGGVSQGAGVNVQASGSNALWFSRLCRDNWPHEVTRVDAAEDYDDAAAFEGLMQVCLDVAGERGLGTFNVGDWSQRRAGRTLYIGSIKSAVRVRLYEKGKEYHARGIRQASPHWVRLEGSFRPRKRAGRIAMAAATPAECFGLAMWTRVLLERLTGVEYPRIADVVWEASDDARAYAWLIRQYGALLGRMCERLGGCWEDVGAQLGHDVVHGVQEAE